MSISEKLVTVAENQQKVYEAGYNKCSEETEVQNVVILTDCNTQLESKGVETAETLKQVPQRIGEIQNYSDGYNAGVEDGKQTEYDRFWDAYHAPGDGYYAFRFAGHGWTDETFRPKEDIVPTSDSMQMFYASKIVDLEECLNRQSVSLDFSKCTGRVQSMFAYNNVIEYIPVLDLRNSVCDFTSMFTSCSKLCVVRGFYIREDGKSIFSNSTFSGCTSLTDITFAGVIGSNGLTLQWSTKLTHDSLMSIINCLADYSADTSGTSWVVTLGATNLAKLTDTEKAIATQKGWTLA